MLRILMNWVVKIFQSPDHWIIWDVGRWIAGGGLHIVEDAPASETSTYGSVSRPPPAEMLTSGLGSKFSTLFSLLFP